MAFSFFTIRMGSRRIDREQMFMAAATEPKAFIRGIDGDGNGFTIKCPKGLVPSMISFNFNIRRPKMRPIFHQPHLHTDESPS
jgi:hypothetical protein